MLRSLSLRDFVIVDRLELEFNRGFTVLTGETGAGKSILIDALSLALGERGESGMIRAGCERAEISAEFDLQELPALQGWLQEHELSDGHACLMRRILYADGRSRGFINGSAVNLQQLREAGDFLVDIYSQHAHHSLLKSASQRDLLDAYAGAESLATRVAVEHKQWKEIHQKRLEVEKNAAAYAEELALLRDQARELSQLNPSTQEWEELQQEHSRLANGAGLISGCEQVREVLAEGEMSILRQLHSAQHLLEGVLDFDPVLKEVADNLEAASIQIVEADRFVNKYLSRSELDPGRLGEVEARIQAIHAVARKHRSRPEELSELLERWLARITELETLGVDGVLAEAERLARQQYEKDAGKLSLMRQRAAVELEQKVSLEMQRLSLSGGKFSIALALLEDGNAHGLEQVDFLVAGHEGAEPRPIAKVASGGELSRISLALRVVTAQQGETPTMIFDEVDVGIGGGVAEVVGQLLRQLGKNRQVLVITHLPQVAAQGASHLRVSKSTQNNQTISRIEQLSASERISEIARMLGGIEVTDTTRKHAEEILALGKQA